MRRSLIKRRIRIGTELANLVETVWLRSGGIEFLGVGRNVWVRFRILLTA